jgi:hypothetical protein
MQLVAYGPQDVYLTGQPQITFWKVTYRRHTNFAVESIEQTFNGQADFGRRVQCTISRNGDLAYRTYLQVTLPMVDCSIGGAMDGPNASMLATARWLNYPGEQLISQVECEIGGQRIDRQYGDSMHIWNQLTLTDAKRRGYDKMVGETTQLTFLANGRRKDAPDSPCSAGTVSPQECEIRNALPQTTLYVPLQFWFCNNPGLAIPLIALQYHEVKINLEFNLIEQCLWAVQANPTTGQPNWPSKREEVVDQNGSVLLPPGAPAGGNSNQQQTYFYSSLSLVSASIYVDYVFLDTDERRRMAQSPHEYLITQLQFTGDESIGSTSNKIKLNFNHPVKELLWVVQPDANVDYCGSFIANMDNYDSCLGEGCGNCSSCGASGLYAVFGAQPFNYTDAIDVLPRASFAYTNPQNDSTELVQDWSLSECDSLQTLAAPWSLQVQPSAISNTIYTNAQRGLAAADCVGRPIAASEPPVGTNSNLFNGGDTAGVGSAMIPALIGTPPDPSANKVLQSTVSMAGSVVLTKAALGMHCWGQNPVVTAKLQLNGQDRFSERLGTYFDLVQPFQHHTASPDTGINVYSFALRPEEHQPTGSCNFSRIDNASLQLVVSANAVGGNKTAKVRVYAINYNVFRVMSGMGGLAYAN